MRRSTRSVARPAAMLARRGAAGTARATSGSSAMPRSSGGPSSNSSSAARPRARLASRAGDALARQPRHARMPGARLRAGPRRLLPRRRCTASPRAAERELERLWAREMPTGVYDPRWLRCRSAPRERRTCARSPSRSTGEPQPHRAARRCADGRHPARANGRYGSTLDYLVETAAACASAASATATSSAWWRSRERTRCADQPFAAWCGSGVASFCAARASSRSASVSMSTSTPASSSSTAARRIARHQPARALVAGERRPAPSRARRRSRPDGRAVRCAARRRRVLVQRLGDRAQVAGPDQRHVARQHEPAGRIGARIARRRRSSRPCRAARRRSRRWARRRCRAPRSPGLALRRQALGGDDARPTVGWRWRMRKRPARARSTPPSCCASLWRPAPKRLRCGRRPARRRPVRVVMGAWTRSFRFRPRMWNGLRKAFPNGSGAEDRLAFQCGTFT